MNLFKKNLHWKGQFGKIIRIRSLIWFEIQPNRILQNIEWSPAPIYIYININIYIYIIYIHTAKIRNAFCVDLRRPHSGTLIFHQIRCVSIRRGHYITNPNKALFTRENPSKSPYIWIVWSLPNGSHLISFNDPRYNTPSNYAIGPHQRIPLLPVLERCASLGSSRESISWLMMLFNPNFQNLVR